MENIEFRAINTENREFLHTGLAWAADWRSSSPSSTAPEDILYIVDDWMVRPGDFGMMAWDTASDNLMGVVWLRYWWDDFHSFGYIRSSVPELGISVSPAYRGLGVGRILMKTAQDHIIHQSFNHPRSPRYGEASISLSVERKNVKAISLYKCRGFMEQEVREDDIIMKWSPGWSLEEMTPDHISEVIELWRSCSGIVLYEDREDSPRELEAFIRRNPGLCFTARLNALPDDINLPRGFTRAYPDATGITAAAITGWDGRRLYVHHLGVHPGFRGLGMAKAILSQILEKGREMSVRKTHLFVLDSNVDAKDFYRHLGWNLRDDIAVFSSNCSSNRREG